MQTLFQRRGCWACLMLLVVGNAWGAVDICWRKNEKCERRVHGRCNGASSCDYFPPVFEGPRFCSAPPDQARAVYDDPNKTWTHKTTRELEIEGEVYDVPGSDAQVCYDDYTDGHQYPVLPAGNCERKDWCVHILHDHHECMHEVCQFIFVSRVCLGTRATPGESAPDTEYCE